MNLLDLALWLLILFTLVYEPIIGYLGYRAFKERVGEDPDARINYYAKIMIGLWLPAICILLLVGFTDVAWSDIGVALPGLHVEPMGPIITYAVPILVSLYCLLMAYYWIGYQFSDKSRRGLPKQERNKPGKSLMPTSCPSPAEKEGGGQRFRLPPA